MGESTIDPNPCNFSLHLQVWLLNKPSAGHLKRPQLILNDIPKQYMVYAEVFMGEDIAQSDDLGPFDLR